MNRAKILYVEDETILGKVVSDSLESRDFDVCLVETGESALELLVSFEPDICLLDIMLKGEDGRDVARAIRHINKQIPIIFLTAKDQPSDVVKSFESGGNDYIRKPFSMEELVARINNLLPSTPASGTAEETIKLGTIIFRPNNLELDIKGFIIKLSYKETKLILMLYENKNRQIDRQTILKNIWGDDTFYNSRNLDVYIYKLRKYLESESAVKIITLKGVGYQFAVT